MHVRFLVIDGYRNAAATTDIAASHLADTTYSHATKLSKGFCDLTEVAIRYECPASLNNCIARAADLKRASAFCKSRAGVYCSQQAEQNEGFV